MRLVSWVGVLCILAVIAGCGMKHSEVGKDRPYHHTENGFRNPPNSPERDSRLSVRLKFFARILWRQIAGIEGALPEGHRLSDDEIKRQISKAGDNHLTWIGHATFLVDLGGVKILTDPVFSYRVSPVSFAGPKRLVRPAIPLKELTDLDVIIISHAHYDHLDIASLRDVPNKERVTVVVPLGLGKYVEPFSFAAIHEVDWYDRVTVKGVELSAYPAIHWSNRTPFDINESLWMSYAIHGNGLTVFHTGDTETHPTIFKEIGADIAARYRRCDVGLMSVGAYAPRPMMRGAHMDPEGGAQIGLDLGCESMVPMHWGTFVLSLEPLSEPLERFQKAAGSRARPMKIGETMPLVSD